MSHDDRFESAADIAAGALDLLNTLVNDDGARTPEQIASIRAQLIDARQRLGRLADGALTIGGVLGATCVGGEE